jgi:hypothetical protein
VVPIHRDGATRGQPGMVTIVPRPYADIFIDGTKVKSDAVELNASLPAGAHEIRLVHEGTIPEQVEVTVPEGGHAPDVRVRLQPLPAHLRVENAQNAGVDVDGKLMGTSQMSLLNPFTVAMPQDASGQPGYRATVKITLTKPGFQDATFTRSLLAGETATVRQELQPQ